LYYMRATLGK